MTIKMMTAMATATHGTSIRGRYEDAVEEVTVAFVSMPAQ
jgi:hypothetical protein